MSVFSFTWIVTKLCHQFCVAIIISITFRIKSMLLTVHDLKIEANFMLRHYIYNIFSSMIQWKSKLD